MIKIIAVVNQKGGVGKTATAYNLATSLSLQGKKTLLIDLDPSGNASRGLISNIDELNVLTISDLLLDRNLDPNMVILPANIHGKEMANLFIVPAKINLAKTQRDLIALFHKESRLKIQVDKIKSIFDYILIDCPPTLTELTFNAIYACDFMLIPVSYERDSLEGINDLFEIIKECNKDENEFKLLRNKYDARKLIVNTYVKEKLEDFVKENTVFETIIAQDEEINKAKLNYEPVITFAPQSKATKQYNALMQEIINYG